MVSSADSAGKRGLLETARAASDGATESPTVELEGMFQTHYGSIVRLLRRFGVASADLDDAAQEVFWVAARRLSDIRPGSEHAFLYGVAIRVAASKVRRERSSRAVVDLEALANVADGRPSPEEDLEQHRARALLDFVLEHLPLELRTVFVLFALEGQSVPEIAQLCAIPMGTASSRLRRAREEFSAVAKRVRAVLMANGKLR